MLVVQRFITSYGKRNNSMIELIVFFLIMTGISIYFLPVLIVLYREMPKHWLIIVTLNILIGWTLIGWLVLVIWAALDEERS